MRWAGHITYMEEMKCRYRVLVEKYVGKMPLGDPGVDGKILLYQIFKMWDVGVWTGLRWFKIGTGCGNL